MKRLNVLVVLPWLPMEMNNGGNQAIFNGLSAISNDVNLIITTYLRRKSKRNLTQLQELQKCFPNAIIEPFYDQVNTVRKFVDIVYEQVLDRFFKTPMEVEIDHMFDFMPKPETYLQYIDFLIKKYSVDIVQTEMLRNLSILASCPPNVKKVFVHHELGFVRNKLFMKEHYAKRIDEISKISKVVEIELLNQCDAVITLSKIDADKLKENGVKTTVCPSFSVVKCSEHFEGRDFLQNGTRLLTFVGPEGHTPNKIGIMWFLQNCWELLQRDSSQWKLNIIGDWSENTKSKLSKQYNNIFFLGFVEDLPSCLRGTTMIVPLTIGSGIRMKILEAANIGVPFVSTSVGVEGLPFINGRDCFIADSPMDFVESIKELELMQNRIAFQENARKIVKEKFSIDSLRRNRMAVFNEVNDGI